MTPELEAIFARPIAHRGYHDADNGVIENTPTAIQHAIDKNFAIEVDVQETADGEALVFHDYTLERLAEGTGRVIDLTASKLTSIHMKTGTDRLWLLKDLFDLVDGRVPLVIEIKSLMRRDAQMDRQGGGLQRSCLHQVVRSGHVVDRKGTQCLGAARHRRRRCRARP
jgi:glycerophosphoryl diester phosphodiesterase